MSGEPKALFSDIQRDLDEVRSWFATQPWKGDPDPGSFGGHQYSDTERKLGYGTYRDPRFLPRALRFPEPCPDCGCPGEKYDGHVCDDYIIPGVEIDIGPLNVPPKVTYRVKARIRKVLRV